jgi:ubiquinone/menaquinone biosynthesis C-methylase UbiE
VCRIVPAMTGDPNMEDGRDHWLRHYEYVAPAWERWADALAAQQEKVCSVLLDEAGVVSGMRVLDLAAGAGEPAIPAAQRVGPTGRVIATDLSPAMLEGLARRASRLGLSQIETRVAAMESLPFAESSFDAVVCRYGLMYSSDPVATLRECARVVVPGGRVAMMTWGTEASNTVLSIVFQALQEAFPGGIEEAVIEAPMRFADAGRLAGCFQTAGLADVQVREVAFQPRIRRGTPFWRPLIEMNAGEFWSRLDASQREQAERAVGAALESTVDDGSYRLTTSIQLAVGRRL